jgi:hypothetical protein
MYLACTRSVHMWMCARVLRYRTPQGDILHLFVKYSDLPSFGSVIQYCAWDLAFLLRKFPLSDHSLLSGNANMSLRLASFVITPVAVRPAMKCISVLPHPLDFHTQKYSTYFIINFCVIGPYTELYMPAITKVQDSWKCMIPQLSEMIRKFPWPHTYRSAKIVVLSSKL